MDDGLNDGGRSIYIVQIRKQENILKKFWAVNMKSIDIEKINNEVVKFIEDRDWDQFHSIKNLSMALSVETSELVEIFQWTKEDDSNKVSSDAKLKIKVEEEIADIFIYLLRIAVKSGINIEDAVLAKIKKNAEKYPVEKAKGSSAKYNDL
jgi:NTP pyrophosphatase (non-canonical NTP hydrolase)